MKNLKLILIATFLIGVTTVHNSTAVVRGVSMDVKNPMWRNVVLIVRKNYFCTGFVYKDLYHVVTTAKCGMLGVFDVPKINHNVIGIKTDPYLSKKDGGVAIVQPYFHYIDANGKSQKHSEDPIRVARARQSKDRDLAVLQLEKPLPSDIYIPIDAEKPMYNFQVHTKVMSNPWRWVKKGTSLYIPGYGYRYDYKDMQKMSCGEEFFFTGETDPKKIQQKKDSCPGASAIMKKVEVHPQIAPMVMGLPIIDPGRHNVAIRAQQLLIDDEFKGSFCLQDRMKGGGVRTQHYDNEPILPSLCSGDKGAPVFIARHTDGRGEEGPVEYDNVGFVYTSRPHPDAKDTHWKSGGCTTWLPQGPMGEEAVVPIPEKFTFGRAWYNIKRWYNYLRERRKVNPAPSGTPQPPTTAGLTCAEPKRWVRLEEEMKEMREAVDQGRQAYEMFIPYTAPMISEMEDMVNHLRQRRVDGK